MRRLVEAKASLQETFNLELQIGGSTEILRYANVSLLHLAAQQGRTRTLAQLLDLKCAIHARDPRGYRPLSFAVMCAHFSAAQLLLERKADANVADDLGTTPLMHACHTNQVDLARLLLEHQAQVNARNRDSSTPLLAACLSGHLDSVRLLLQLRAPGSKDGVDARACLKRSVRGCPAGSTAVAVARQRGFTAIVDLLKAAGFTDPGHGPLVRARPVLAAVGSDTQIPLSAEVCSFCGHGSAVLKWCSRCRGARYCGSECQRSHWPLHKNKCKSSC